MGNHLTATAGDIAPWVLMPGDPLRARRGRLAGGMELCTADRRLLSRPAVDPRRAGITRAGLTH